MEDLKNWFLEMDYPANKIVEKDLKRITRGPLELIWKEVIMNVKSKNYTKKVQQNILFNSIKDKNLDLNGSKNRINMWNKKLLLEKNLEDIKKQIEQQENELKAIMNRNKSKYITSLEFESKNKAIKLNIFILKEKYKKLQDRLLECDYFCSVAKNIEKKEITKSNDALCNTINEFVEKMNIENKQPTTDSLNDLCIINSSQLWKSLLDTRTTRTYRLKEYINLMKKYVKRSGKASMEAGEAVLPLLYGSQIEKTNYINEEISRLAAVYNKIKLQSVSYEMISKENELLLETELDKLDPTLRSTIEQCLNESATDVALKNLETDIINLKKSLQLFDLEDLNVIKEISITDVNIKKYHHDINSKLIKLFSLNDDLYIKQKQFQISLKKFLGDCGNIKQNFMNFDITEEMNYFIDNSYIFTWNAIVNRSPFNNIIQFMELNNSYEIDYIIKKDISLLMFNSPERSIEFNILKVCEQNMKYDFLQKLNQIKKPTITYFLDQYSKEFFQTCENGNKDIINKLLILNKKCSEISALYVKYNNLLIFWKKQPVKNVIDNKKLYKNFSYEYYENEYNKYANML